MEARFIFSLVLMLLSCQLATSQTTYQANSDNFIVYAPDPGLARKASNLAEQYRKELSLDWLGYEIDRWREKCPIYISIGPHAGGETSFAFIQSDSGRGEPISWQMKIYGPMDRLLDAVLPHEVTHTIFATHFGRPLPRWADEGACTTVEHESERAKNHRMLIDFLSGSPSRGIPFNKMFTMKQYPNDILPLYAQGYSVARYLIEQKGRQHFVQYVEKGMSMESSNFDTRSWDMATNEYYGFEDLSDLQVNWLKWVHRGSPKQAPSTAVASSDLPSDKLIDPNRTYTIANTGDAEVDIAEKASSTNSLNTWYARQSRGKQAVALPEETLTVNPGFRPGSLKRFQQSSENEVSNLLNGRRSKQTGKTIWR